MINEIFIYCDRPSHRGRRTSVATFRLLDDEAAAHTGHKWGPINHHQSQYNVTEQMLMPDNTPAPGLVEDARERYRLVCRKCKDHPVVLKADNADRLCDGLAANGVTEWPLAEIGAKL